MSQTVRLDSVVYTNPDPAPPYPYEARRDSLRAALVAGCDSARAATDADWVPECHLPTRFYEPRVYISLEGVVGGWEEAQAVLEQELPVGFRALLQVEVAWDGSVQEARLRVYRGDLGKANLALLVRRLRFDLTSDFGFPTVDRIPYGVRIDGAYARRVGDP
ncbi:MAG: hypothetical protein AAFU38_01230 [Bacteroidota bacterium]